MRRRVIAVTLLLAAIAASGIAGWLLFHTTTRDNPALGVLRFHRFFGRVTKVSLDVNRDGRADAVSLFHWNRPYQDLTDVPQDHYELREDRNFDGRFDTWLRPVMDNGSRTGLVVFEVDLDGDGEFDWRFETEDSLAGYETIRKRRGY
jgi:hypothetical protein